MRQHSRWAALLALLWSVGAAQGAMLTTAKGTLFTGTVNTPATGTDHIQPDGAVALTVLYLCSGNFVITTQNSIDNGVTFTTVGGATLQDEMALTGAISVQFPVGRYRINLTTCDTGCTCNVRYQAVRLTTQ
jgi:hypothetical protein